MVDSCPPRWNLLQPRPRWSDVSQYVTRTNHGWIRVSRGFPDIQETPVLPTSPKVDAPRNL